jgi:type VI secretion system secreted protein Hcp
MKRLRVVLVLATITACLTLSVPSWAALNAYLRLKGQKQGDIKGSVTQKGRADKIMVIAVDHSVQTPIDLKTGIPTSNRQHKPLVIRKEVDKSSPLLHNAQANNELLTEFELEFWQPSATGVEKQHYTIQLTNAHIISIHMVMPNSKDPALVDYAEYEEVAFTYQKITWTWMDGGITAEEDW